jgi:hypothetical protein
MTAREIAAMVPLILLMVFMGLYPRPIIARLEPSVAELVARVAPAKAIVEREHHSAALALSAPAVRPAMLKLNVTRGQ